MCILPAFYLKPPWQNRVLRLLFLFFAFSFDVYFRGSLARKPMDKLVRQAGFIRCAAMVEAPVMPWTVPLVELHSHLEVDRRSRQSLSLYSLSRVQRRARFRISSPRVVSPETALLRVGDLLLDGWNTCLYMVRFKRWGGCMPVAHFTPSLLVCHHSPFRKESPEWAQVVMKWLATTARKFPPSADRQWRIPRGKRLSVWAQQPHLSPVTVTKLACPPWPRKAGNDGLLTLHKRESSSQV